MSRACNGCTLCCKLVPVEELDKKAGQRCQHQRTGKGCSIYEKRPMSCRFWTCYWLDGTGDGIEHLSRPDHVHYVIDTDLDYISARNNETGQMADVPVIQIWCDPKFPEAHRDPGLRAWLEIQAEKGLVALVRYSSNDAFVLSPPNRNADRKFHEMKTEVTLKGTEHSYVDKQATLARIQAQGELRTTDPGDGPHNEEGTVHAKT